MSLPTNTIADAKYQGISFDSAVYNVSQSNAAQHALDEIVDVNANSVAIVARYTVANATSSTVYADGDSTESLQNIEDAIKDAQARGLSVMLKPHVTPDDHSFSGSMAPKDVDQWFASYKTELLDLARVAETNHVEVFSLGNELTSLVGPNYTAYWEDIISSVRDIYSGSLTLAAQYWQIDSIQFWDQLDFIGVNAYIPLSKDANPTAEDIYDAWTSPDATYAASKGNGMSVIEYTHQLSEKWDRPILITEIGFRSVDGAAANPGDYATPGATNEAIQTAMYKGFFDAWSQAGDWFAGTFMWGWNIANGQDNDYSVQGKSAYAVLAEAFGGKDGHTSVDVTDNNDSVITIRASGKGPAGYIPDLLVVLDGLVVGDLHVTGSRAKGEFIEYTLHVGDVDPQRLQLFFDNPVPNSGLYIDWIEVNGTRYQAEGLGVVNNAIPAGFVGTAGMATMFTTGSLTFDLQNGIADGHYTTFDAKKGGTFTGTSGDDYFILTGANTVSSGDGNDIIDASKASASKITAGAGDDVIIGSAGNDTISTGEGRDRIIVTTNGGVDTITDFSVANDVFDLTGVKATSASLTITETVMNGVRGTSIVFGGSTYFLVGVSAKDLKPENFAFTKSGLESDFMQGTGSDDHLVGNARDNTLYGRGGHDLLEGGGGNDVLFGNEGNDRLFGNDGNDLLEGGAGADVLNGGAGTNFATYTTATGGIVVDMRDGSLNRGDAQGDSYVSIQGIIGTSFNDSIYGDNLANELRGGDGDDYLAGRIGDDRLEGGAGNDILNGGDGADTLIGGAGSDFASYEDASVFVRADLSGAQAGLGEGRGDTFDGIEGLIGSRFNDWLYGNSGDNVLIGGAGNDNLGGGAGNDILYGGDGDDSLQGSDGDDVLYGGAGADSMVGGSGFDIASYAESKTGIVADMLNSLNNTGEAKGDTYLAIEGLRGSAFNDLLVANQASTIWGGDGNDRIVGGAKNDILYGERGDDILSGGGGKDKFVFSKEMGHDTVVDFTRGTDTISLDLGTKFDSFAEIQAAMHAHGNDTLIDFGDGNTLMLIDTKLEDLVAHDFSL